MNTRHLLISASVGAALMFMLDPTGGGRRRARVRDKMTRAARKTRDGIDATARDMANRTAGIAAAAKGRWSREPVSDRTLLERVRAKVGRVSSHPHAIDAIVCDGEVTLRGPVLSSEVDRVVATVEGVRGVRSVRSEVDVHESAEGIPALQGAGRVAGSSLDILQRRWAPATRTLVSIGLVASGALMAIGAVRGTHHEGYAPAAV